MADDTTTINTGRLRRFDRAVREKWNKYTWSGLAILIAGLLVLVISMSIIRAAYPGNVLLDAFGILLIIIGVIRILIGFITPATPLDIIPSPAPETPDSLDRALQGEAFGIPDPRDE